MKNVMNSMWNWIKLSTFIFALSTFVSCETNADFSQETTALRFVVSDFPAFDEGAATRAVGTPDVGKTAWADGDEILVLLHSPKYGDHAETLRFENGVWGFAEEGTLTYLEKEDATITAVYAPDCEIKPDKTIGLKEGKQYGMAEYILANATIKYNTLYISFTGVSRTYSRLRIATMSEASLTLTTTNFTPAGPADATAPQSYTLTADDSGNAYLYGTLAANATIVATAKHQIYPEEGVTRSYTVYSPKVEGKSYVLGVKLGEIVDAALVEWGFVAFKDGSFGIMNDEMTEAQKSAAVGIVFWATNFGLPAESYNGSLTNDKVMNADFPHCTHGLIVSLKDMTPVHWQLEEGGESVYDNFQNTDHFNPTNVAKSEYVSINPHYESENFNLILGYNNTKILEAYNAYCKLNNRSESVVGPVDEISLFAEQNPAPLGSTGWYLPSIKELHLLCHDDVDDIYNVIGVNCKRSINDMLLNNPSLGGVILDDRSYWSSTEEGSTDAFVVDFGSGGVELSNKSNGTPFARYVCAF